jgi:ESCRT-I complex subunit TSG101
MISKPSSLPSSLIGRLFNLVAEDLAIEDTMEILAKALDYERITLDAFLKVSFPKGWELTGEETRKLAREQFLIKALIQKILRATGIVPGHVNGVPDAQSSGAVMGGGGYYS